VNTIHGPTAATTQRAMTHAVPWPCARAKAESAAALVPVRSTIAMSLGGTLAEPLRALAPLPGFDTAAMDGYAVSGHGPWRVVGRSMAGHPWVSSLSDGEACEVATGALVPSTATGVLPVEQAQVLGDRLTGPDSVGLHIRRTGEEVTRGELLLPAGVVVTPVVLGLAAATGHDHLLIHSAPTVRLIVSGDEIVESGIPVRGSTRDALGPMLPGLVHKFGGIPTPVERLRDDHASMIAVLKRPQCPVLVTTGASGNGPADHLRRSLSEVGAHPLVQSVACRPGHPMFLFRLVGGEYVVGLPGNPLAALAGALTLLAPLLNALRGLGASQPVIRHASEFMRGHRESTRLMPVHRTGSTGWHGAAMLRGAAEAEGLAVIPPGQGVSAGQSFELLPL
jgi:molybdopterin molybdotransferase